MRTFLHTTLFWGYVALTMPVFFAGALAVWLLTIPFDRDGRILHLYTSFWAGHTIWLNPMWRLRIEGREHIAAGRPFILCANHQSAGDIAVLFALFRQFKFVSKQANFFVPFLGWAMAMNRYIPIRRGSPSSARKMLRRAKHWLGRGVPVMMFPEGTRSEDGRMLPFKLGSFTLAMDVGVPVIPIVLDRTGEALPKSGVLSQPEAFDVPVKVGAPIDPRGFADARELASAVRASMEAMQRSCWRARGFTPPVVEHSVQTES